jgi:hypothetical protein
MNDIAMGLMQFWLTLKLRDGGNVEIAERYGHDESVAAYQWKLSSRHPRFDICNQRRIVLKVLAESGCFSNLFIIGSRF